jgi:hypothetical protein
MIPELLLLALLGGGIYLKYNKDDLVKKDLDKKSTQEAVKEIESTSINPDIAERRYNDTAGLSMQKQDDPNRILKYPMSRYKTQSEVVGKIFGMVAENEKGSSDIVRKGLSKQAIVTKEKGTIHGPPLMDALSDITRDKSIFRKRPRFPTSAVVQ